MTEPNFRKHFSGRNSRKYAGKNGFWYFLEISSFFFPSSLHKTWPSQIFEKIFFRPKIPEICQKSPFSQVFIGLFPTIKHGDWLKPELSKNCRKNGCSWISRAVLYIFSWTFAHWCKMTILEIFSKNCRNSHLFYRKTDFLQLLESYSIFHSWIFALFFRSPFHSFACLLIRSLVRSFVCFSGSFPLMSLLALICLTFIIR